MEERLVLTMQQNLLEMAVIVVVSMEIVAAVVGEVCYEYLVQYRSSLKLLLYLTLCFHCLLAWLLVLPKLWNKYY